MSDDDDYSQYSIQEIITFADYTDRANKAKNPRKSINNSSESIKAANKDVPPVQNTVNEHVSSPGDVDEDVDDAVVPDLLDEDGQRYERDPITTKDPHDEDNNQEDAPEDKDIVIELGGIVLEQEEEKEDHESWVKRIRKENRELKRANKQLQAQATEKTIEAVNIPEVFRDPKPTIESCDYDSEVFQKHYEDWYENKARHEENVRAIKAKEDEQNKLWNQKLQNYEKLKADLGFFDMDEAEEFVSKMLNKVQAGILIQGAKDPAKLVYALGKCKGKCKELASISDPIVFAMELGKLEGDGINFYPRKKKDSDPKRGQQGEPNPRDTREMIRDALAGSDADFNKFCESHPELHYEIKTYMKY